MTQQAVAPTDELVQAALAIHQGHRNAIHLGLHPDILSSAEPVTDGRLARQLLQTRVRDRMT